ncbi:MAG: SH3 domain-containing protein [Muricoprocola sp.]
MDTIREWISDNLRYILLGIALVLVLVLAVFGVRAVSRLGSKTDKPKNEVQVEQTEESTESVAEGDDAGTGTLVQNDAEVLKVMTSYYSAKTNKDIDTLKKLDPSIDEELEKENLESSFVKSYTNIRTYSKNGPEEGSCVVYVYYDGEVDGISTKVPSLTQFYLKTNEEGSYYIADITGDTAAAQFVEDMKNSTEVQELINSVNSACEEAKNSDPVLKEFMSKYGNSQEETEQEETEEIVQEQLVANDACNVRKEPDISSDANIIGGLVMGDVVTKIGEEGDWTKIDFNGQEAYVKSEFLSSQETEDTENADDITV